MPELEEEHPWKTAIQSTAITKSAVAADNSKKSHTIGDRFALLQTEFVPASSLPRDSDNSPPRCYMLPSTPTPAHAHKPSSNVRSWTLAAPSTRQGDLFFTSTPPSTQPRLSNPKATRTLSRQLTDSSVENISSFSLTPSPSLSLSSSSTPSSHFSSPAVLIRSNDSGYNEQEALGRIHEALFDMIGECRICWVNRTFIHPHTTYHCSEKMLSNRDWEKFKSNLRFPDGVLCYFCLVPYGSPFYHQRAPEGSKQSPKMCEYPDALKELVYIIYENRTLRQKVFAKLGIPEPSCLYRYKQCVTAADEGQLPAVYKIIDAYLRIREEQRLIA
jgi:hypothetical protein